MFALAAENGNTHEDGVGVVLRLATPELITKHRANEGIREEDYLHPIDVGFLEEINSIHAFERFLIAARSCEASTDETDCHIGFRLV